MSNIMNMSQPHVIVEPEVEAKRSLLLQKSCHLIETDCKKIMYVIFYSNGIVGKKKQIFYDSFVLVLCYQHKG